MGVFSRDIYPGTRGEPRLPPAAYKIVSDAIQATQLGGADPRAVAESASRQLDAFLRRLHRRAHRVNLAIRAE